LLSDKELMIESAKSFMLQASSKTNGNVYDHISKIINKLLTEKPKNAYDVFESFSEKVKKETFQPKSTLLDDYVTTEEFNLARLQKPLFEKIGDMEADMEAEEEIETPLPNVMELASNFEQAGIGLGKEEMFRILLSLKHLIDAYPLQIVRFWGKIFGMHANYIIAEVMYREGEDEDEGEEEEEDKGSEAEDDKGEEEEDEKAYEPPKPNYKPPTVIPKEDLRVGANKYVYFVCNKPGEQWTKLPSVTPAQIVASRKIKKMFTGNLESSVVSYPPFPGLEGNYLRAQIARISAGTHISPVGFYIFDEDEEHDDEEEAQTEYVENPEYEPVPVRELIDDTVANWVHHVQYILPQGRCTWFNPNHKNEDGRDDEEDEEDEEEDQEEPDEPEPEQGPPLLTPLSEDVEIDTTPAWSAKLSSTLVPQYALAIVQSNLWPGAVAFSDGKKFENVYIGYGHKYNAQNYSPPPPPPIQREYPSGPDITEAEDPTVEEEVALKAAQEEALAAAEEEGEEED